MLKKSVLKQLPPPSNLKKAKLFLSCSFLIFYYHYTQAQSTVYEGLRACGVTGDTVFHSIPESELNHCFDVDIIQQHCIKVWLRVNIHFFLDDDCEGTLDPLGIQDISIDNAYTLAEDIITRVNNALENNRNQWVQYALWGFQPEDMKEAQCVPFRYVLSGVYPWCNTNAQNMSGFNLNFFQSNFGQNADSEFNVYFVELPGNANGVAPWPAGVTIAAENFGVSTFNHEMGHVFSLPHSFEDDGLNDTPQVGYRYDYNCDGDSSDVFPAPGVGSEMDWRQCWDILTSTDPVYDRSLDYDGNGTTDYPDLCDLSAPCLPYPCCSWDYVNNNIMSYSRYTECCAAYTEGQITQILERLSTDTYCEYIEEITDDCPPPMANIHVLPNEGSADDCSFCLQLSASMHDDYYRIDFHKSSGAFLYSTGLLSGPASRFCLSKSLRPPYGYPYGFQPGEAYTAVLTVENYCGDEAEEEIAFIFEEVQCAGEPGHEVFITGIYPNPFSGALQVDYKTEKAGHLEIWLMPAASPPDVLLHAEYIATPGNYQQSLSAGQVSSGTHYLILSLDGETVAETVIKL